MFLLFRPPNAGQGRGTVQQRGRRAKRDGQGIRRVERGRRVNPRRARVFTMSFLFKHNTRSPAELVKQIRLDLKGIEGIDLGSPSPARMKKTLSFGTLKGFKDGDVALHKTAKHMGQLRKMLVGDESIDGRVGETGSDKDGNGRAKGGAATSTSSSAADGSTPYPKDCAAAVTEMCVQGLIKDLCLALTQLDLEVCRDITACINAVLGYTAAGSGAKPGVDYFVENSQIFDVLSAGFQDDATALHCGNILRECNRSPDLCKIMVLEPGQVLWNLFEYAECAEFSVQSDVFDTLKELLLKHKGVTSELLADKYDRIIGEYTKLLTSEAYMTKKLGLGLLGKLLLEHLKGSMLRYINDPKNLMLMMNLLKDKAPSIQYEAFHVFKVFVANPDKAQGIVEILSRNHKKLISYLENFHNDKDNEQFKSEKVIVLQQINLIGLNH